MDRTRERSGRRWSTLTPLLAALFLAAGLAAAPPNAGPALAAGPLRLGADATYSVDPEAGRIHVVVDVEATNLEAPSANVIYYYEEIFFGIQPEASRIRASDAAGSLATTIRRRDNYTGVTVHLRSLLYYRDTARFQIRFDLVGAEPRSTSPIRVGAAFATFGVWAWGDTGRGSVEVRLPPGFRSQILGDSMERIAGPDGDRLRAEPEEPYQFYAVLDTENPEAYERTRISIPGDVELIILAWPEDDAWQETVATTLQAGMPVLQALIGLDWPVRHDLEVRERYTPSLEGYAGVFYADESIDVSEDLDPLVIVHEASHAWFNDDLFAGRWIQEGLAQEYAWRVLSSVGDGGEPPERPSPDDPGAIALTEWSHPGVIRDQETDDDERYGYAASWWVVHRVVSIAGEERMRLAFAAATANTTAYPGVGAPEKHLGADGFARFLDLVEDIGQPPSSQLDEAFREFVMTPAQTALLDARRDAREAYRGLLAAGDGWLPPWYVRRPMADWQFSQAEERIDEASEVLALRDRIADGAEDLELEPDGTLRSSYETALAGFAAATEIGQHQLTALDAIDEARLRLAAEHDLLTTVGLLDATPEIPYEDARIAFEAGELEQAVSLAGASVAVIAGAAAIGQGRVLVAITATLVVLLLALFVALRLRRRRRMRAAAAFAVAPAKGAPPEAYATLAADRDGSPDPPVDPGLEGGAAEGGSPFQR